MIGVGWPNGPVTGGNQRILALPGSLLMLSSEHWHVKEAQATGKKVLYRIVPPIGQRPAELNWNAVRYAEMIKEQVHGLSSVLTDLVWANELDLNYERGDSEDDFQNLPQRYSTIAAFSIRLLGILQSMYPGTKIHWPAFTPNKDHQAIDHVSIWKDAAYRHDVINFHAYDTLENIQHEHALYSEQFPTHPLELTEFHGKGNLAEEIQIFQYLLEQNLESYFFIYEWFDPASWWSEAYDIANNPERYAAIEMQDVLVPDVEPEPMPDYNAERPQWQQFARKGCIDRDIPYDSMYHGQIDTESRWNHYTSSGEILTSPTGSKGLGQLNSKFYGPEFWTDPYDNLTKSMDIMNGYYDSFGSWKKALAAYNWGPSNVAGYRKDGLTHPAWDGTREWVCPHVSTVASCRTGQMHHYLDTILGPQWAEPNGTEPQPMPPYEYNFGIKAKALELGLDTVGDPISPEIYIHPDISVQFSTKGKFEYTKHGNLVHFFPRTQG